MLEKTVHATLLADLFECGAVLWHAEHGWQTGGEVDCDGGVGGVVRLEEAGGLPAVGGEPHDLLRRAGTLDHTCGLGEDGVARFEALNSTVGFVTVPVVVDGRDEGVGVFQRLVEALDAAKIERDARRNDELFVRQLRAVLERKRVLLRSESARCLVVELELGVQRALQVDAKVFLVFKAATDQRPARLVVVPLGWVDDGDVVCFETAGLEKLMADRSACRAATDNNDLVATSSA